MFTFHQILLGRSVHEVVMAGHVARMGETNTYRFLVVKPEKKTNWKT